MIKYLLAFTVAMLSTAANAATLQKVDVGASCVFGAQTVAPAQLFNYREPDNSQCQYTTQAIVRLAPSAVNAAVNFADLFPAGSKPLVIGVADISAQAFDVGLESGGERIHINPNGYFVARVADTSPILYLDNPSGSQVSYVKVFGLSGP